MLSHTRIRKASFKALLISPVSSGPFPNKGFGFPPPPIKQMPVKLTKWRLRGVQLGTRMHRLGKDFLSCLHLCHPDLWGGGGWGGRKENQLLLGRLAEKRAVIRAQSRNRDRDAEAAGSV